MEPRALGDVLTMPIPKRLAMLAEGIALLVEHAATLRRTVQALLDDNEPRAAAIVDAIAEEESAKVLILLDLVRLGWRNQSLGRRQVSYFYSHLARGIYAELVWLSPQDFREVREIVDNLRASHYLDGPNDVDWIYRNRIEAKREEAIYVDYVRFEDRGRWVSPQANDDFPLWHPSTATELVVAMQRAGLLAEEGLGLTQREWEGVTITPSMHWQEAVSHTRRLFDAVGAAGLQAPDLTKEDVGRIMNGWSFPMFDLDLSRLEVTQSELSEIRSRVEQRQLSDYYGTS